MSASDAPKPSATVEFPISEMEREIIDLIPQLPQPPRWPAFNALRHLNQAWRLRSVDTDMMIFRCITAEEEAATALFRSFQRRKYEGSGKLKVRQHVFKNAVIPFVEAVGRVFASLAEQQPETQLFFNRTMSPPQFQLRIKVGALTDGRAVWAKSKPLHFSLTHSTPEAPNTVVDFSDQMAQLASDANAHSIRKYLEERANFRNKLLYATTEGYYAMSGDSEAIFQRYQRNVFTILKIYLMIDPYEQIQNFAQQCLNGFLAVMAAGPKEKIFE